MDEATILWQRKCPGHIETEVVDGVILVTCYVGDGPGPPPPRVTDGLQCLYTFEEGSGSTVHDVSGVGAPLDLILESEAAVAWLPEGGLVVRSSTHVVSPGAATKVIEAARASDEITVEAWIKPSSLLQDGPARIITLSADYHHRNLQLGQAQNMYDVRLRTTETTANGRPSLSSPLGSLSSELEHVVCTREASGLARIYVAGAIVVEKVIGGDFSGWDAEHRLALANEVIGSRPWLGEYHLVAIYARALNQNEVMQNLEAGTPSL